MPRRSVFFATIAALSCLRAPMVNPRVDTSSQVAPQAKQQLGRFLDLALATRKPPLPWDSVYTCADDMDRVNVERALWIADYKVLSMSSEHDSVKAVVALTSVVDEAYQGFAGWISTLKVREDTAHFTLVRETPVAPWKVCGETDERYGVRVLGYAKKWVPAGASRVAAVATIDSIRRSRHLTIVR
jgi:hypothetical protein